MVSKTENDCLVQSIKNLPFSNDFKLAAEKQNFKTIGDILQKDAAELLSLPGFNFHILQELTQFTQQNNVTHLLKQ